MVPRITIETEYESSQHFAESVPKFFSNKLDKAEWVLRIAKQVEYEIRVGSSKSELQLVKFKMDKAE